MKSTQASFWSVCHTHFQGQGLETEAGEGWVGGAFKQRTEGGSTLCVHLLVSTWTRQKLQHNASLAPGLTLPIQVETVAAMGV